MSSNDYYRNIVSKWQSEYPSSGCINEVWSFYKECGYADPQKTLKGLLDKVQWTDQRVLDLGCDNGFMLKIICDWFPEAKGTGIDINPTAIDKANESFPELDFLPFDGVTIPFEDKSFDLVFISAVVKHIRYDDREHFYSEVNRVAKQVLIIEADTKEQEEVSHHSWTFYNSDFKSEFNAHFDPVEVIHEAGDILGLYKCR